jgi:hypothetical protein
MAVDTVKRLASAGHEGSSDDSSGADGGGDSQYDEEEGVEE